MIDLFYYKSSTCSQKVQLALFEKGLDFTAHHIDLAKGEHLTPAYLKMNPNGVVPTLRHDGQVITDSSVIMEYLDEAFPEPALSGRAPLERARIREWLRFIEEVPTVAVRIPSFKQVLLDRTAHLTAEQRRAQADRRPLRQQFYRSMEEGISDDRQAEALQRLSMTIARMDGALTQYPWLCGSHITIADLALIPTFDRLENLGHAKLWQELRSVSRWWQACNARGSFAKVFVPGVRLVE
ncbi:glutathione S-transferase family protein [Pseudooceanicola nitratireducens]|uniref:glutathione S-transferase family protein n=1 Tax=Pseudooceanicola nitratireducens TaxID=517719 RepID=UPI0023F12FC8|nr:glutathione S-transferase family protein [Pseudooceanicola nitratireducens]